jgi:PAS domain S-box-containing protein
MTGVDGEERWFQAIKVPQFDDKGNVVGLIGIARDISQHKRTEEAIRKSEERYRALFESTGTANMVLSAGGVFLMMNELAARYLRGTPKDLVGKSIHDFFPKEACNEYLRRFRDVVDSGEGKTYEDLVELSTGNRWFLTNMHPVEDTAGNMTCVQLISQDITERKRAEEVLRQSEERLRLALSAADMGTWRWDPVINQDTRDASFNRILGLSAAESTQPVEDFLRRVHPDDRDMVDKEIQCAIRDRQPYLAEFRIVRPDGAIRWLRDQGKVLCDEDDRVSYMTGAVVDITEHRRTEEALRESEQRFRSLVEASSDWVWEVDRNGIYTYASPKVKDLLGYEPEEIIGKTPFDLMPPDEAKRVAKLFNGIVESRKPFDRLENTNLHKDGRLVVLETSGVPILGERKNLLGYRGIDRDITERKRAREALQKAYDELETRVEQRTADLARAVEELRSEISERKRAQEQLRSLAAELTLAEERLRRQIATDVHDHIGQNLAISKIKLESLRGSISSPELATGLDEIRELIAQTIESSRSLTFELSPPVLYELGFEAAVEWLVRRAREQQGLSTDFKTDGRPKPLGHDVRVLLFQAVRELLLNVAKHANARNVTVWSRRVADEIQVAVEDDGVGFDTSKTTSRDYETGGFGLFSIRERLRSIGGRFDIESKPGTGTRVTLAAHVDNGNEDSGEKRK